MEKKSRRLYIGGSALFAAVALLVAVVFTLLCRTDKTDTYLADTRAQRFGWRYTLLSDGGVQDWAPVFESDYAVQLPPDTRAVRLTRAMTESIPRAELEWNLYCTGVEVTLDGAVLYTDFAGAGHDADGFARPAAADWARINARAEGMWRRVRMTLPADYVGQTLCVTTYFSPGEPVGAPEYPTLGSEDSLMALMLTEQTLPTVSAVFYALLALVLAGMFALDVSIGGTGAGTLLMCLFYALLFLDTAYNSETGYYSLLQAYPALGFLSGLELVPLFLFMTMRRKTRLKYPLCAGIVLWAVCVGALQFRNLHDGLALDAGRSGLAALGIFAALLLVFLVDMVRHRDGRRIEKDRLFLFLAVLATVTVLCMLSRGGGWGSIHAYLGQGVLGSMAAGQFGPLVGLLAQVASMVATVFLSLDIIMRAIQTRSEMDILRERSSLTLQGYQRMVNAEQRTNAARHEMRHHMTVLLGLLDSGDTGRLRRYLDTMAEELDSLPAGRYSQNLLVNVIAGAYLDRAQAEGIRVEHMLPAPQDLPIADEDISVLLSNMLQNALEACERMPAQADRFIRIEMSVFNNFLFIKCANSMPADEDAAEKMKTHRPGHGYGLAAMRRIAKKYGSTLTVEPAPGMFAVKTALSLDAGASAGRGASAPALPEQQ